MLDFPSLLYKGLRILMFQLSGVYCRSEAGSRPQADIIRCPTGCKLYSPVMGGSGLIMRRPQPRRPRIYTRCRFQQSPNLVRIGALH